MKISLEVLSRALFHGGVRGISTSDDLPSGNRQKASLCADTAGEVFLLLRSLPLWHSSRAERRAGRNPVAAGPYAASGSGLF